MRRISWRSGGLAKNILAGILAEMGDITRFDDVSEIQKLSGLGLVSCSSGKHRGGDQNQPPWPQETEILAVPGSKINGIPCGGIQGGACVLYDKGRQSAQEDAVADCDCL